MRGLGLFVLFCANRKDVIRKLLGKCKEVFNRKSRHCNHSIGRNLGVKQFPADAQNAVVAALTFFNFDVHVFRVSSW